MRRQAFAAGLGGALLLSLSAMAAGQTTNTTAETVAPLTGAELRDKTVRAASIDGAIVNTVYFDADGSVRIQEEPIGDQVTGRWFVRDERLCIEWEPRGRECWPYQYAFTRGQPATITSDRGQRLVVTLL